MIFSRNDIFFTWILPLHVSSYYSLSKFLRYNISYFPWNNNWIQFVSPFPISVRPNLKLTHLDPKLNFEVYLTVFLSKFWKLSYCLPSWLLDCPLKSPRLNNRQNIKWMLQSRNSSLWSFLHSPFSSFWIRIIDLRSCFQTLLACVLPSK